MPNGEVEKWLPKGEPKGYPYTWSEMEERRRQLLAGAEPWRPGEIGVPRTQVANEIDAAIEEIEAVLADEERAIASDILSVQDGQVLAMPMAGFTATVKKRDSVFFVEISGPNYKREVDAAIFIRLLGQSAYYAANRQALTSGLDIPYPSVTIMMGLPQPEVTAEIAGRQQRAIWLQGLQAAMAGQDIGYSPPELIRQVGTAYQEVLGQVRLARAQGDEEAALRFETEAQAYQQGINQYNEAYAMQMRQARAQAEAERYRFPAPPPRPQPFGAPDLSGVPGWAFQAMAGQPVWAGQLPSHERGLYERGAQIPGMELVRPGAPPWASPYAREEQVWSTLAPQTKAMFWQTGGKGRLGERTSLTPWFEAGAAPTAPALTPLTWPGPGFAEPPAWAAGSIGALAGVNWTI